MTTTAEALRAMYASTIAFDPGVTTGVAQYSMMEGLRAFELRATDKDDYLTIGRLVHRGLAWVVYETYQARGMTGVSMVPAEVIGLIQYKAYLYDIPIKKQEPSQAKQFWTDDKLKKVGEYIPGKPHANDAIRHLLHFQTFTQKNPEWMERLK